MRLILLAGLAVLSTGCSWILGDNQALSYLDVQESAETQVPEGITLNTYDRFPVPEVEGDTGPGEDFITPVPERLTVAREESEPTSLSDFKRTLNPRFVRDGAGTLTLQVDARFALAWSRVADALAATDIRLTDLNRSIGTYFLELPNPEAEADDRSWWGRLWGDRIEPVLGYQLKMIEAGEGVYLTLQQDAETLAEEALTRSVLDQVKQQLEQ
jgi:outer membrane protein assembly factor BamC